MICNHCGQETPDGSKFCNNCGKNLNPFEEQEQEYTENNAGGNYSYTDTSRTSGSYTDTGRTESFTDNNYYTSDEVKKENKTVAFGVVALIFGIISIITFGVLVIPEIVAIVCGAVSRSRGGKKKGYGTAGLVCGIVGAALGVVVVIVVAIIIAGLAVGNREPAYTTDTFDEQTVDDDWDIDDSYASEDFKIDFGELPKEITCYSFADEGVVETIYDINAVSYEIEYGSVTFTIAGEKTFGDDDGLDTGIIGYKLYDSEGYVVDSGQIYPDASLSVGDKFKEEAYIFEDIDYDDNYRLEFSEVKL